MCILITSCKSSKVEGFVAQISGTHRGKLIVYFNEPKYPPLRKHDIWYAADLRNKNSLSTSTSVNIVDETCIQLVNILDADTIDFEYIQNSAIWYSGKDTRSLKQPFTNKEFFIAYIYKDKIRNYRSRDSVVNFVKSINGDTTHVNYLK
jgi:hypothetical protein